MRPMAFQRPWMVRSATLRRWAFQLGEGLLDWVEIGAVGREEEQPGASCLNGGAYGRSFVARQVVHNDDVAARELRCHNAGYVGGEGIAVHWPVEHPGRDHAGPAQPGHECRGLPMAARHTGTQPRA